MSYSSYGKNRGLIESAKRPGGRAGQALLALRLWWASWHGNDVAVEWRDGKPYKLKTSEILYEGSLEGLRGETE